MTSLADVENPDKALVEFWRGVPHMTTLIQDVGYGKVLHVLSRGQCLEWWIAEMVLKTSKRRG
jgi:hypothetical protein